MTKIAKTKFLEMDSFLKPMEQTHVSKINHTYKWRIDALKKLREVIITYRTELCEAIASDLGRSHVETWASELILVEKEISLFQRKLKRWMGADRLSTAMGWFPMNAEVRRMPLSSPAVLVIGPFNYPVGLSLLPVVGALGGGNPVVLKPSEHTPKVAEVMERILNSSFDAGVLRVVNGGVEVSQRLLQQSWGMVFFTGSERVGKIVASACALTNPMTPCVLEMGGKSPVYVDEKIPDRKLRILAKRLAWGKTFNSGQTCVAPDYLLCHKDIQERFLSLLVEAFAMYPPSTIVSNAHAKRLVDMMVEVEEEVDTKVLCGGSASCEPQQREVCPTVVLHPSQSSKLMREEIFGPILPVQTVSSEKEAMEFINRMPGTPLCLYVFSNSYGLFNRFVTTCPAGGAMHNEVLLHFTITDAPFGGLGTSGIGRYKAKHSFDLFTHHMTVAHHTTYYPFEAMDLRYPPYNGWRLNFFKLGISLPDIHPFFLSFWPLYLILVSLIIFLILYFLIG